MTPPPTITGAIRSTNQQRVVGIKEENGPTRDLSGTATADGSGAKDDAGAAVVVVREDRDACLAGGLQTEGPKKSGVAEEEVEGREEKKADRWKVAG